MPSQRRSELVQLVMPNATEAEIEEATRRWFGFLDTINSIVVERERARQDSLKPLPDATVEEVIPNL